MEVVALTYAQQQSNADDACSDRFDARSAGASWVYPGFNVWQSKAYIRPFNLVVAGKFASSYKTLEAAKVKGEELTSD